ncbi:MAG: hypothetical protein AAF050_08440 [Cyanobacteria bacterium J06649_5]
MSRIAAHKKEHLLSPCFQSSFGPDSDLLLHKEMSAESHADGGAADFPTNFSLECLLRAIKIGNTAGLLARTNYYFPSGVHPSSKEVFRYTGTLNTLLLHSKVFVVKDLDGDRGYYLRMDTVLEGQYESSNITDFFRSISADVEIMVNYFNAEIKPRF